MVLNETPVKTVFIILVVLALIFTIISMFTPGWRYTDLANEGVIVDHYMDRQPYEKAVIAFLSLALIFEVVTLIAAIAGFVRLSTPHMLLALAGMAYLCVVFLLIVLIVYGAGYKDAHGLGLLAISRATGTPLGPGYFPYLSLGYSYWFSLVAAILLLIAGIVYVIAAFTDLHRHRHTKHTEVTTHTHHIQVHS